MEQETRNAMSEPVHMMPPPADAATGQEGAHGAVPAFDAAAMAQLDPAEQARMIAQQMGAPMPLPGMAPAQHAAAAPVADMPLEPQDIPVTDPAALAAQQMAWAEAQARAQMEAEAIAAQQQAAIQAAAAPEAAGQPMAYDPAQMAAMQAQAYAGAVPGHEPGMAAHAQPDLAYAEPAPAAAYAPQQEDLSHIRPIPRISVQAFCETGPVSAVLDAAAADRRMSKAHVKVQQGGIAAATDLYQQATTPNLILLETQRSGPELIQELENLAAVCDEGTNVVVIGHRNDIGIYRDLVSRGVAEYLVAPVTMAAVMEVINALFVNPESDPLGHSIAFIGAKGGVGSSTVAHNVAWAIASEFESDVMLADLDLAFGTANIDFDQDPAQGVAEAVFSNDRIDDTLLDRLLAKCTDHLSLLAAPSTLDREYDFEETAFDNLLEVAQRGTPNVILDVPHLWTAWSRRLLAEADKVVITATPDLACLRNTKNMVDTLRELRPNDDKPFLVLNQMGIPKRPEISAEDFADPLDLTPAATIAFEPALFGAAANNGQMISESDPKHAVAGQFLTLAQMLTGRRELTAKAQGGSLAGLLGKLKLRGK